jgi:hypothetical protein
MENKMNASMKLLVAALALSLPVAASAQSNDAKYCAALVDKYNQSLNASSRRGQNSENLDAKVGIAKCQAGDTASGIPMLEKALKDAKYDLPPRT